MHTHIIRSTESLTSHFCLQPLHFVPAKLTDKTYKELVDALKDHHEPKLSEIVQRCKFNSMVRQPGESVSTFVSQLRSLAEHCNFGTAAVLQDMLRDRLVCGINSPQMQQQLLAKKDLTFESALSLVLSLGAAVRNVQTLQGAVAATTATSTSESTLHKVDSKVRNSQRGTSRRPPGCNSPCFRCGKSGHGASKCRFKSATCHKCGKTGHIKAVCRSSVAKEQKPQQAVDSRQNLDAKQSNLSYISPLTRIPRITCA